MIYSFFGGRELTLQVARISGDHRKRRHPVGAATIPRGHVSYQNAPGLIQRVLCLAV